MDIRWTLHWGWGENLKFPPQTLQFPPQRLSEVIAVLGVIWLLDCIKTILEGPEIPRGACPQTPLNFIQLPPPFLKVPDRTLYGAFFHHYTDYIRKLLHQ